MLRRDGLAIGAGACLLFLAAAAAVTPPAMSEEDEELLGREVYVPHPEFRAYPGVERLTVEGVTLVRVRREDGSEALVAREASGWEHVVLEGFRLSFYNQARLPLRATPGRHVIVRDWSGGAHCCFDYHVFHVEGGHVLREGMIRGGDCSLQVADVDRDGSLELIGCDSRFAYAFDLPFAESPLLPVVYTFRDGRWVADNPAFPQVFRFRAAQERRRLTAARRVHDELGARRAVLSLTLHLLYAGRVTEAWCTFERHYPSADRAAARGEILDGLRRTPDPDDLRTPPVDLRYALVPPKPCP